MIAVTDVGKQFGPDPLFEHVSLQLDSGRRYGLVGANGSGKSTFLRMLIGEEPVTDGTIVRGKNTRLGALKQDRFVNDDEAIVEVAMRGDEEVFAALKKQQQLGSAGAEAVHEISELNDFIEAHGGYTLESRASEVVVGLGIPASSLRMPLSTLSGGYKLRVLLAQVLVGRPDILLLDEPTNHLDILSIRWLEKFLGQYEGLAVVISHDHRFLNNIATHILDVDYETIIQYTGNYDSFLAQKQATYVQKQAQIERQEKIIAEKMAFIERFRAKATKARQAQSRVKQVEKIQVERLPTSSRHEPRLQFAQKRPSGRDVLRVEGLCKAYGDKVVLRDVELQIRRGERVAIIGANGLGKSTLLRALVSRLTPDAGKIEWGHETQLGYFPQDHREVLTHGKQTPLAFVWEACNLEGESYVRGQLGRALFSGDDVKKPIEALSGGESARLIFARLAVEKPNVLLLDEPTNHLDLESIEGLIKALKNYDGTIVFVSHDRWFVGELADRVIEVREQGITDFPGSYAEYLAKAGDDHLDSLAVSLKAKQQKSEARETPADKKPSYEERKRIQNRLKALPRQRDQLLAEIDKLEARKAEIQAFYCEPNFYVDTPEAKLVALRAEEAQLATRLDTLVAEWEQVETELGALNAELARGE